MRQKLFLYPFLFAVFPVLSLFLHNINEVLVSSIFVPIIVLSGVTAVLLFLFGRMLNSSQKAAIIVSIFWIIFFSYIPLYRVINIRVGGFVLDRHRYLLPIVPMFFLFMLFCIKKTRHKLENISKTFNIIGFCLVIITLSGIVLYAFKTDIFLKEVKGSRWSGSKKGTDVRGDFRKLPDIYYIVFDRYGSSSAIKDFSGYDNSAFIQALAQKGFYIATESSANYPKTEHSLVSSLNMEYINFLEAEYGADCCSWRPLVNMLQDHRVGYFLKDRGYRYLHFGSWFDQTRYNRYADENINLFWLPRFSYFLFKNSILYPVFLELGIYDFRREQWKRVLYKFEELGKIPQRKEPTFVFAHMLVPHYPYVFDKEGNFVEEKDALRKTKQQKYIEQLVFVNKMIRILVERLITDSDVPPIIILQGDEGPYPVSVDPNNVKWTQVEEKHLKIKMGILNAYYLPKATKFSLYPRITPVNSFRLVFRTYFGGDFSQLPDENYVFASEKHIYKFYNVTNIITAE